MIYCTKCGAQLRDDSFFCEQCGSRIPTEKVPKELIEKKVELARVSTTSRTPPKLPTMTSPISRKGATTDFTESALVTSPSDPKHSLVLTSAASSGKKRSHFFGLLIIIFIVVGVAIASGLWMMNNTVYAKIKEFSFRGPLESGIAGIQVNVSGRDVKITITSNDKLNDNEYEVIETVFGPLLFSDSEASYQEVLITNVTNPSNNETWTVLEFNERGDAPYRYELTIILNHRLKHSLHVDTNIGSVDVNLVNAVIDGDFYIGTDTGSIQVAMRYSSIMTSSLLLTSDAGSIDILLEDVTLSTLEMARVTTNVGSISMNHVDVNATTNTTWIVETDTGSVDLSIVNNLIFTAAATKVVQQYEVATEVGSIDVVIGLNPSIGMYYSANTSVGSVSVTNLNDTEIAASNELFLKASFNYELKLSSNIGSISISGV